MFGNAFGSFPVSFGMFGVMFNVVFVLILGVILVTLVRSIGQWSKNNHSPRLTVDAKVVAKRTNVHSSHRPPGTLNENLPALKPRTFASGVASNSALISLNTPVNVAGLLRGVRPIGLWSISINLSIFSTPTISS